MLTARLDTLGVTPDRRLLDLGCGAGRHTFAAVRRGAHTVSCDLDGAVLKDVAGMCGAMKDQGEMAPGISAFCVQGDGLDLPFADAAFDRVIASEVLEHIRDDGRAIVEIARVLETGGAAAVTVPRWWPELVCWALSRRYRTSAGGHVRVYRRRQLIRRLRSAGLVVTGSHHAHALHSPYWWLRCALGVDNDRAPVRAYKRFLEWDIVAGPRAVRRIEQILNPILGKSLVLYVKKAG